MNEQIIRRHSGQAVKHDRTDWARFAALTDDDIEAAIADDPDSFARDEIEWLGSEGDAFRYRIVHVVGVGRRWEFVDAAAHVIAHGEDHHASRDAVLAAIAALRDAVIATAIRAA